MSEDVRGDEADGRYFRLELKVTTLVIDILLAYKADIPVR